MEFGQRLARVYDAGLLEHPIADDAGATSATAVVSKHTCAANRTDSFASARRTAPRSFGALDTFDERIGLNIGGGLPMGLCRRPRRRKVPRAELLRSLSIVEN
jgi:hypothetical protein